MYSTVWKCYDFSISQILRKINIEDFRSAKSAILTHLEALNLDIYDFMHFKNTEIYQIKKSKSPKTGKNCTF